MAKEGLARAVAALGQIAVLGKGGKRERVDAGLKGAGELMQLGAAFLVRDGALDEAEVVANAAVEFAEGGDGAAVTSAAKGTVKASELRRVIRVGGGEVVVLAHLRAKHGEALREGIPGADADAGIDVARQATPAGLSVGEEGRERLRRGGEASIVGADLVGVGEGERGDDVVAGSALCAVEGGLAKDGATMTGRGVECDKRVREVVVVIDGLKGGSSKGEGGGGIITSGYC